MANKRIQGITIELDGNSKKLQTAILQVDNKLRSTQADLRDINKLLKLDPGNTELLAQKQERLAAAIEETKERLNTLRNAQKGVGEGTAEYDAIQREIIDTEQQLKSLEGEYGQLGGTVKDKIAAVVVSMKEVASKFAPIGQAINDYVIVPLGHAVAEAGKAALKIGSSMVKSAVSSFGEYEQLAGGVETLFGRSSRQVMKYAEEAYRTAGMSANEYMETVTGFSASLLQSVGGDTVMAAHLADMAIRDMSDNANKMGTDIDSIKSAYAGFARQNYTMLDNLKLGYGGTKKEMERLLADAEAISGVHYDINNYADVVKAIHVMQTEIGITGTTAAEAEKTIQGSLASTKGAWENLLTSLGTGKGVKQAAYNLVKSVQNVLKNIVPVVKNAIKGLGVLVKQIAPVLKKTLPKLLKDVLPGLLQAVVGLVKSVASALPKILSTIAEAIGPFISELFGVVKELVESVDWLALGTRVWEWIKGAFATVGQWFGELFGKAGDAIKSVDWAAVGTAIWNWIKGAFATVGEWFGGVFETAVAWIKSVDWAKVGVDIWNWIKGAFATIGEWFSGAFKAAANWIRSVDWAQVGTDILNWIIGAFASIADWYTGLYNDIATAIEETDWEAVGQWIWDAIASAFNSVVDFFRKLFGGSGEDDEDSVQGAIKGVDWKGLGESIWRLIKGAFNAVVSVFKKIFENVWSAIEEIDWAQLGKDIWDWIKGAFASIGTWFMGRFEAAKTAIKNVDWAAVGTAIWDWIKQAFAAIGTWFSERFEDAKTAIKNVDWAQLGKDIWNWIKGAFASIGTWFMGRFETAKTAIKNVDWAEVGTAIWNWIKGAFASIGTWFSEKFEEAVTFIESIDWAAVGTAIWDAIKGAITGVGTWFKNTFKEPINAVIDMLNGLIGTAEGVVNTVIKGINKALTVKIPAKDFGILGRFDGWSWSPGLKTVNWGRIDHLYKGGVLREGERATVGEYAPEYLTVRNGQAVVTPIKGAERWGGGDTYDYTFNVYAQPGKDARQIAAEVQRIMVRKQQQRRAAYA